MIEGDLKITPDDESPFAKSSLLNKNRDENDDIVSYKPYEKLVQPLKGLVYIGLHHPRT